jgi:hypothetical protein
MAKLTRKLWVGIGLATVAGAVAGDAGAQAPGHKAHVNPPPQQQQDTGDVKSGEGGEAYLTDGGPKDTRIRFYRDIELMRGHLLVGGELIALELWDDALPHFLHPTEELYGGIEKYIKLHSIQPFNRDLQALAQAVKAKRKGAYDQALKVVDRRLTAAIDATKKFMTPQRSFAVKSAVELLKAALSEYDSSMQDGKFIKPVEYQDSRGFVWEAERMIERLAGELAKIDKEALELVRADFTKLKAAWPTPMPPPVPLMELGQVSALVSDIELHVSRY